MPGQPATSLPFCFLQHYWYNTGGEWTSCLPYPQTNDGNVCTLHQSMCPLLPSPYSTKETNGVSKWIYLKTTTNPLDIHTLKDNAISMPQQYHYCVIQYFLHICDWRDWVMFLLSVFTFLSHYMMMNTDTVCLKLANTSQFTIITHLTYYVLIISYLAFRNKPTKITSQVACDQKPFQI